MFKPCLEPVKINVSPSDYHKIGAEIPKGNPAFIMSRSQLAEFGYNANKWLRKRPEEATKAMDWGSVMDTLLFTPDDFEKTFAISPRTYPCKPTAKDPRDEKPWNKNATYCKEWEEAEEAAGKIVISEKTSLAAADAFKCLLGDEVIANVRRHSDCQVQALVEWHCPHTGLVIPFKVLLDLAGKPDGPFGVLISDFKTTFDASPKKWRTTVWDQELYYQAAVYLDAYNAATGLSYDTFSNLVQESTPPYATARRIIDEEFIAIGRQRYRGDFLRYCMSLKENLWPGYDDTDLENEEFPCADGFRVMVPAKYMLTAQNF